MELTPIYVPGKKKRKNDKAAVEARKALKRRVGRPLKISGQNEDQSSAIPEPAFKNQRKKTLKNIKSRRKMSDLEKLPTEILETVFLFCLTLNLPNASPVIAGKLSSSIMFNKTILAAFGPTWERWHGRQRSRLRKRVAQDIGDCDEDPVLQSAVLRCRWATLPILLNAKDIWVQRFAEYRIFKPAWFVIPSEPPPADGDDAEEQPPVDEDDTENVENADSAEHAVNVKKQNLPQMSAQEYLNTDFQGFSDLILGERDGGWLWDQCSWDPNSDVADGIEIPSFLLSGPWNEESLKYLFWLIKSGAIVDFYNSTSGELALEGLRKAINLGDIRAIHLLAWAGAVQELDVNLLSWAFRNAGGDKFAVVTQLLRLNFSVMQDKEARKIDKELADMMDEARQDGDEDQIEFVEAIAASKTLDGKLETMGRSAKRY